VNTQWINCPEWDDAQRYWQAFWHGELLDRPPVLIHVPKPGYEAAVPEAPDPKTKWSDPEFILQQNEALLPGAICLGEALPVSKTLQSAWCPVYGGSYRYHPDTIWIEPFVTDWDCAPDWGKDWDDEGWRELKRAYGRLCEGAEGRYFVGLPPMLVPNDLLAMFRGTENFLLDLVMEPERVLDTLAIMQDNFIRMWNELDAMRDRSSGYGNWWPIWCPERLRIVQSDVSCMISSEMYEKFILPEMLAFSRDVDHLFYHLDGPDAIHHLEMICSVPKLRAIQWVPGSGNPGHGVHWMDLYKRVQSLGKAIWISSSPQDLEVYLWELDPRQMLLSVGAGSVAEAQEIKRALVRLTAAHRTSKS